MIHCERESAPNNVLGGTDSDTVKLPDAPSGAFVFRDVLHKGRGELWPMVLAGVVVALIDLFGRDEAVDVEGYRSL